MRLIDADELLKYFFRPYSNEDAYTNLDIKQIIDNAPTVTVDNYAMGYQDGIRKVLSERPQGEWIDEGRYAENYGEHVYRCKECGYHIITHPNMLFENRYCKNCGAKMGGSVE